MTDKDAEKAKKAAEKKAHKEAKEQERAAKAEERKAESTKKRAELEARIQARKDDKARQVLDNLQTFGKVISREFLASKTITFYEKGYVSVALFGSGTPEKLIDITTNADVSKKTGLGRGIVAVASGGLNLVSSNMRGDINVTIVTDATTHLIHVSPPSETSLKTARKIEATGKGLLARLNSGGQPSSAPAADLASQIAKLVDLNKAGVLTDEEFSAAKAKLLG